MKIYELRKIASRNKKHKYIYQLVVSGEVIVTRRSNLEYIGIWIEGAPKFGRYHWFQTGMPTILAQAFIKKAEALALTFDELVKFSNVGV